jgi:hypothetical protein
MRSPDRLAAVIVAVWRSMLPIRSSLKLATENREAPVEEENVEVLVRE